MSIKIQGSVVIDDTRNFTANTITASGDVVLSGNLTVNGNTF